MIVQRIFIEEDVDRIIELKVLQHGKDALVQLLEALGQFLVKFCFHAQNLYYFNLKDAKIWQKLWSSKIHYRLKVVLWRFARVIVLTKDRIQLYANLVNISCSVCSFDVEIDLHIMVHCDAACIIWFRLLRLHLQNLSFLGPMEFLAIVSTCQ